MTTQICIDSSAGRDCLTFTRPGKSLVKTWQLEQIQTRPPNKSTHQPVSQPDVSAINRGHAYVSQSAHQLLL